MEKNSPQPLIGAAQKIAAKLSQYTSLSEGIRKRFLRRSGMLAPKGKRCASRESGHILEQSLTSWPALFSVLILRWPDQASVLVFQNDTSHWRVTARKLLAMAHSLSHVLRQLPSQEEMLDLPSPRNE